MARSKCFCGGCGDPIMWMTTETGKMMPVNWDSKLDMVEKFDATTMVTHFSTCKNANDFRKKKSKKSI